MLILSCFISEAKTQGSYHDAKVSRLESEIDRVLKNAISEFSVADVSNLAENLYSKTRISDQYLIDLRNSIESGSQTFEKIRKHRRTLQKILDQIREEKKDTHSDSGSYDSSIEQVGSEDLNATLFGPNISDAQKPQITRILEKMAGL